MITTILQHDSSMFSSLIFLHTEFIEHLRISEYSGPGILQPHNIVKVIQYNFAHPRKPPNLQQTGDMKDVETPNLQEIPRCNCPLALFMSQFLRFSYLVVVTCFLVPKLFEANTDNCACIPQSCRQSSYRPWNFEVQKRSKQIEISNQV